MMLTSIFSSDFLVVVNSVFPKGEPVDRHRGDNQASVIIIQWQEWKPCDCRSRFSSSIFEFMGRLVLQLW